MIRIELLSAENFKQDSLDNYPRKQDVKKVYRKLGGEYILEDCVYMGAELADCPIKKIAEDEPYDLQMICYV